MMEVNQPKVFEFAKELGMETLALMDKLREWKLPVKNHMAELEPNVIDEIKKRLAEEKSVSTDGQKKKVVKKAPAKKVVAKKAESPEAPVEKKAVAKAPAKTTTKTASPKTKKVTATTAAQKIIRRKAGEAEAKAEARAAEEAAIQEAQALAQAQLQEEAETSTERSVEMTEASDSAGLTESKPDSTEPKRPRNIVGRMDLRRVQTITPERGSGGGAAPSGAATAGGRPAPRTAQRNIRTGFVAPVEMDEAFLRQQEMELFEKKEREEKEKKKRAGSGREEEVQNFSATEFRKREVIFQPKKKKAITSKDAKKTQLTTPAAHKRVVKVYGTITVEELAQQMGQKAAALIKQLMLSGVTATVNASLDFDTVALIVPEFGFEAQNLQKSEEEMIQTVTFGDLEGEKQSRPPVVTIMGHVDHGKTTLLDSIRKANVAKGEAGGITQHIGAYSVKLENGHEITFLDTPGHEAFTAMRARGANVTDIAIIVVAADDGLMPQTAEAINHAKAAEVPLIIAVNKMDKPGANPDRIKQQLTEFELVPEEWGGNTIFAEVSALTGKGVKELLESILLVAEIQELKANPNRSATGVVIESRMEKGRGCVATVLVQEGTLKVGQFIAAGLVAGKVRSMMNDKGETVKSVLPGYPVEVTGLPETPEAGDRFDVCKDESAASLLVAQRKEQKDKEKAVVGKLSIEEIMAKVKKSETKELSVVLKADVAGSLEAVKGLLDKSGTDEVKVKIIHTAVGGISESDVLLAGTSGGIVLGFNVRPDGGAQRLAKEKGVEIKTYSIIYELIDDIKKSLVGLLAPQFKEISQGRAEVRNTFSVPKFGTIAGCAVVDGKITRNHMLRLVRDGKIVYEGKVSSLKRFKDDVREVASGYECGIGIENFNDIKTGDVIESFTKEQVTREL